MYPYVTTDVWCTYTVRFKKKSALFPIISEREPRRELWKGYDMCAWKDEDSKSFWVNYAIIHDFGNNVYVRYRIIKSHLYIQRSFHLILWNLLVCCNSIRLISRLCHYKSSREQWFFSQHGIFNVYSNGYAVRMTCTCPDYMSNTRHVTAKFN